MAGSVSSEVRAEPNLTPLLDVVFQLITFFMLVINFTSENYDRRVHLPVAGSARPVEDTQQVSEDRLVLNIDKDGHLLVGGQAQSLNEAIATIKHHADLVKLNLSHALVNTLVEDIHAACETLEKKGGVSESERKRVKTNIGM